MFIMIKRFVLLIVLTLMISISCFSQIDGFQRGLRKTAYEIKDSSIIYYEAFFENGFFVRTTITQFNPDLYIFDEFLFKDGKLHYYTSRVIKNGVVSEKITVELSGYSVNIRVDDILTFDRGIRNKTIEIIEYKVDKILELFKNNK